MTSRNKKTLCGLLWGGLIGLMLWVPLYLALHYINIL